MNPFPPGRPVIGGNFYVTNFELEYLSRPNEVVDDIDPSPLAFDLQSTLDTLYKATGGSLVPPGLNPVDVVMTRYHPTSGESLIFTGFNIWSFRRSDCKSLVDFVLQQLWGLSPGPSPQIARAVSGEAWRPVRRADR